MRDLCPDKGGSICALYVLVAVALNGSAAVAYAVRIWLPLCAQGALGWVTCCRFRSLAMPYDGLLLSMLCFVFVDGRMHRLGLGFCCWNVLNCQRSASYAPSKPDARASLLFIAAVVVLPFWRQVLWVSDPVHGNTIKTDSGYKTRKIEDVRSELRTFFDVHQRMGTHAGGVSLALRNIVPRLRRTYCFCVAMAVFVACEGSDVYRWRDGAPP